MVTWRYGRPVQESPHPSELVEILTPKWVKGVKSNGRRLKEVASQVIRTRNQNIAKIGGKHSYACIG